VCPQRAMLRLPGGHPAGIAGRLLLDLRHRGEREQCRRERDECNPGCDLKRRTAYETILFCFHSRFGVEEPLAVRAPVLMFLVWLCERTLNVRGFPLREEGQVAWLESPNGLSTIRRVSIRGKMSSPKFANL
jgi:hypothetical protein